MYALMPHVSGMTMSTTLSSALVRLEKSTVPVAALYTAAPQPKRMGPQMKTCGCSHHEPGRAGQRFAIGQDRGLPGRLSHCCRAHGQAAPAANASMRHCIAYLQGCAHGTLPATTSRP